MEAALTIVSVVIGLYAGWRMLGRSARAVWAAAVNAFEARRGARPAPAPHVLSSSRSQQHDAVVLGTGIKAVSIPPLAPNATEREIVRWLAGLRTADTWRYSANAIYMLVKGNRNDVLAWVRQARGLEDDEPEPARLPEQPHIQVPAYEPPPR